MAAVCQLDEFEALDWYVPARPAPRPSRATYRRRRRMVGSVLAAVAIVLLGLRVGPALGGVPASAPERSPGHVATYTVRPGDTLWSIAGRIAPEGNPRSVVAALIERNGGDAVRVGQLLSVPVSLPPDPAG